MIRSSTKAPRPPAVLLLGPAREALSGVSTHLNLLFASPLAGQATLRHFQVGGEGRAESPPRRALRLLASPFALAATLLAQRVDILHLNTSLNRRAYWRDLAYLLVGRLCGVRVVYQVHGGELPAQFAASQGIPAGLLRATLRLPQAIVVLAGCECRAYRAFLGDARVHRLPNAIDAAPYLALGRPPAAPGTPLRLLYLGRLVREKGLFEALEGLQRARQAGAPATLVLAGSGPDEAALRAAAAGLRLGDAVHFAGPVFGADKLALLAAADALLFPTYAEGLPYALLEAMAAGLPAITTPVGAIPDLIDDGVHGILVPPRDAQGVAGAIARLAGARARLAPMGAACRARIRDHHAIQRLAGDFSRLYAGLLPPRPAARRQPMNGRA